MATHDVSATSNKIEECGLYYNVAVSSYSPMPLRFVDTYTRATADSITELQEYLTKLDVSDTVSEQPAIQQPAIQQLARQTTKKKSVTRYVSIDIRNAVWRLYSSINADKTVGMDGYCWCCCANVRYEDAQLGHIQPHAHGGCISIDNLRPICYACNKQMGSLHMYEYMLEQRVTGVKHLDLADRMVVRYQQLVLCKEKAQTQLAMLRQSKRITAAEFAQLQRQISSKKFPIAERITVLEHIASLASSTQ